MFFKTDTAKIKRWREERHWSQEHLAQLAGVGLRTLQRIENGQQASSETLKALANAFNVDVVALSVDPEQIVRSRQAEAVRTLRLSFLIHAACYVVVAAVFMTISIGLGRLRHEVAPALGDRRTAQPRGRARRRRNSHALRQAARLWIVRTPS